jgi:broad specificity phosphatase PhoE
MSETTVVHLLRHGEVENPDQIIYGRLPGYHLSANGQSMARAAEDFFADRHVGALFSSPLERALETARPVAERLGLPVVIDERLIEPWNHFEGLKFGVGDGSLRRPVHWPHLINPFLPSWGEPYRHVVARMLAAMAAARAAAVQAGGQEGICVSHQLPIWVTRRYAEGRRLWHNPMVRQCALGSVTSFSYETDRIVGVSYTVPARRQVPQGDAAQ